jgi:hypothetical protein
MDGLKFDQIVGSTVSSQGISLEKRACPDQYVGTLSEIVGQPQFPLRVAADQRTKQPCLIMVLESPHVDEFIDEPGPAKGFTGDMIRNFLPEAISLPDVDGFGLVLVNAIQHQCSLGTSTTTYRDKIFRAVWAQGGEGDFAARLQSVVKSGDIVMNCCTKGNDFDLNTPLRSLVEASIRAHLPDVQAIRRMHPASWRTKSWRGVAWRYPTESKDRSNTNVVTPVSRQEPEMENKSLEEQITLLKNLGKNDHGAFNSETAKADRENSIALLSAPESLVTVKENEMFRGSSCTVLVMGDGSQRHMKTSTFDPDGAVTQKAKTLVGSRIRTTCWDPKASPGRWSSLGYFRNIYSTE